MADVNDYSTTPASNTADFPENQAPSTVNDGGRETQADIAKWRERLEGEATVGGTVDAITLTFSSPHTALVDNRLMTFEATGANTSATPTLKEDSLVAKTIVKYGNQPLAAGDIYGAGHVCIVQYDSGNDNYELLNPVSKGTDITGYVSGVTEYIESDVGGDSTTFDVDAVIGAAWESVGPTGSGATNIWTALDSVPAGAKWVELRILNTITGSTNGDLYGSYLDARINGSSTVVGFNTEISKAEFYNRSGSPERASNTTTATVPIDTNGVFELYLTSGGTTPTITVTLVLSGWGI